MTGNRPSLAGPTSAADLPESIPQRFDPVAVMELRDPVRLVRQSVPGSEFAPARCDDFGILGREGLCELLEESLEPAGRDDAQEADRLVGRVPVRVEQPARR